MKQLLFLLLGTIIFFSCSETSDPADTDQEGLVEKRSHIIPIDEARMDLESLLATLDAGTTRDGHYPARRIQGAYSIEVNGGATRTSDGPTTDLVHIFNFEDDHGFAIMSGDRRMPSLLAITEKGYLHPNDTIDNPGFSMFLDGLAGLYTAEPDDKETGEEQPEENPDPSNPQVPTTYYSYGEWKNIVYHQNGLCRVKWGQDYPYNKFCPLKNGERTVTGCAATALAQLMYVNKYPASYNGYSFYWDSMITEWSDMYGNTDEVARLMQQLGLSKNLDMDYGTKRSDAAPGNLQRTLKAFGYTTVGSLQTYETSGVVNELKDDHCVILSGYSHKKTTNILGITSTSYSGGHCWIGHGLLERRREVRLMSAHVGLLSTGYESEWYILCNFGWDGDHDGYYLSKVFDARGAAPFPDETTSTRGSEDLESGEDDYIQYKLRMITGIRK